MSQSIGTTRVDEIMNRVIFTVGPNDKLPSVAKLFEQHDINAAPVVDDSSVCIGIITSRDLAEFAFKRVDAENACKREFISDDAQYGDSHSTPHTSIHIDEAGVQMSRRVESVAPESTLSVAAQTMCRQHIHHLVILNDSKQPVGILSSLDILGHIMGEAVARRDSTENKPTDG